MNKNEILENAKNGIGASGEIDKEYKELADVIHALLETDICFTFAIGAGNRYTITIDSTEFVERDEVQ